jgi:hypothetical protein
MRQELTMKMRCFVAAPLLVASLAISGAAHARNNESNPLPRTSQAGGREVAAPSWSAACMTDHGPSQCDEPMWVYGSGGAIERYKRAF